LASPQEQVGCLVPGRSTQLVSAMHAC
jgi:hypothetical protein